MNFNGHLNHVRYEHFVDHIKSFHFKVMSYCGVRLMILVNKLCHIPRSAIWMARLITYINHLITMHDHKSFMFSLLIMFVIKCSCNKLLCNSNVELRISFLASHFIKIQYYVYFVNLLTICTGEKPFGMFVDYMYTEYCHGCKPIWVLYIEYRYNIYSNYVPIFQC